MAEVPGTAGYREEAPALLKRYERRNFEDVHRLILDLLPPAPALALEIGAGTGRDAAGLAARGYQVIAVEPVDEMRQGAQALHPDPSIVWIDDGLPDLKLVAALKRRFDLVMMTAVLMHLNAPTRARALAVIASLMKPGGLLAMTLRHGPVPDGRTMFDVSAHDIRTTCAPLFLSVVLEVETVASDQADVTWTRLVLRKAET
jgi:SAM-dependent methyltransferase